MAARRAEAHASPSKSRKSSHELQVDQEVSRQLDEHKETSPAPKPAAVNAPRKTNGNTSDRNTDKPLYRMTNQDIEHEIQVAKQNGDDSHEATLRVELQQRKAKIKEILGQASSAKAFVKTELPKLGDNPTAAQENRFFRGLYRIMPSLKSRIEKIRNSDKAKKLKDIDYVGAVIESVAQTLSDHIIGGVLNVGLTSLGVTFLSKGAG